MDIGSQPLNPQGGVSLGIGLVFQGTGFGLSIGIGSTGTKIIGNPLIE
jgi:hypothetical protein